MYGIKTCGIKSYLKVFEEKLGYKIELNNGKLTIKADEKHKVSIKKMESPFRGMSPHYEVYTVINKEQYAFFGNEENTVIHLARLLQVFIDDYVEANHDTFILDIRNLVRYTYSFFKNHIENLPLVAYDRDVRDSVRLNEFTTYTIEEDGLVINILSPHITPYGLIITRGTKKIKFDDTKEYESILRFKYLFEERNIDFETLLTKEFDGKYTLLQKLLMKEVFEYHD